MRCEIDSDGEFPLFPLRELERKARKPHKCGECGRVIAPGEVYRYESGVWEKGPDSHKTCMDCLSVREAFFCSYTYGEIWDELLQYAADSGGSLSEAKINSLTPAAREKLLNLLDEILEED